MAKKEKMRAMFNDIASDYDSLNHIMSLGVDRCWRRRAIREVIDRERPQHILDLACGTGDFSIEEARHMAGGSHVTGVDLSEGMLRVMKEKVASAGLQDRISIEQGEGEGLRFPDGTFDVVTIAFGIRNFEDRESGLKEMLRVLKPGGRLLILELSEPEPSLLRWCYNLYFKHILPLIGKIVSGNSAAYRYLPASVIAFPGRREWTATMQKCGFADVTHKAFSLGICRMYIGVRKASLSPTEVQRRSSTSPEAEA